jgi:hypothetical protein
VTSGLRSLAPLLLAARHDRHDLALGDFSPAQIQWAVTAGLGPWLRRCTAQDPRAAASPAWPLVQSADLTARFLADEKLDAMEEILDHVERHVPPLTLLKGISLCQQHYPEPHLRTMGDIDVLVDEAFLPELESRLMRLGYRPQSTYPREFYASHHHAMPLFHPRRRVWIEIHRGLFPAGSPAGPDEVFSRPRVAAELEPSTFRGHRVNRLTGDLQLVYVAAHWGFGFKRDRALIGMLDVIRLLDRTPPQWSHILAWLEGSFAATYVHLLLSYLTRRGFADVDPAILDELAHRQRTLGRASLSVLHAVLDRYVVAGRPFDSLVSARTFGLLWPTLLSPGRPTGNALRLGWRLLPSSGWVRRQVRLEA